MAKGKGPRAKGLSIFLFTFALCHLPCPSGWSKSHSDIRNELPTPFNLQAVSLKKTITLTWQWSKPEELPAFKEFGYEIKRQDGKVSRASETTYADLNVDPGSYTYVVRAHGLSREKGKPVTYVSDWSEPAAGGIKITCPGAPVITLTVEPTQKAYSSVPSLRFHIQGQTIVESGCTLRAVSYHLDTGTGIIHSGPLPIKTDGRFDTFINAFGPDDEIPSGHVSFSITASAEDEVGPTTSSAYTVDVELQNPFAPRQP